MKARLDIIGDPIIDYWQGIEEGIFLYGGALNTYDNCIKVSDNTKIECFSAFTLPTESTQLDYPIKNYLIDYENNILSSSDYFGAPASSSNIKINRDFIDEDRAEKLKALVVSDYKKGFVENNLYKLTNTNTYNFIVVDSRYANTDIEYLRSLTDILIHRRTKHTDKIFSNESLFDWVIETDGRNQVIVNNKWFFSFDSIANPVSTCGAGDVFTASFSSHLLNQYSTNIELNKSSLDKNIPYYVFYNAIQFATSACQDAITRPFTCKTKLSI